MNNKQVIPSMNIQQPQLIAETALRIRKSLDLIDPQYHERIFTIFQTLQARDSIESTGIGLSIVKKIVESQGGKIWVESQLGQGATFYFTWRK